MEWQLAHRCTRIVSPTRSAVSTTRRYGWIAHRLTMVLVPRTAHSYASQAKSLVRSPSPMAVGAVGVSLRAILVASGDRVVYLNIPGDVVQDAVAECVALLRGLARAGQLNVH